MNIFALRGFWLKVNSYGNSPSDVVVLELCQMRIILHLLTFRCTFYRLQF